MRCTDVYRLPLLWALAMLAFGCPASRPMSLPPGEAAVLSSRPAGGEPGGGPDPEIVGALRKDGAACFSSAHCLSNVCEGASCDSSRPGTCVPSDRACTTDLVAYCGCDGKTFLASSSCPGEAFVSRKACEGQEVLDDDDDPLDAHDEQDDEQDDDYEDEE